MEFGVSTYVVPRRIDGGYLDPFHAAGISLIEIGFDPVHVDPDDVAQHRDIRDRLEALGMRAHSIHAGYDSRIAISDPDPGVRREFIRQARHAACIVTALGGDVVVVHPGGPVQGVVDMDAFAARVVAKLPELVYAVVDEGARVALENANPRGYPSDPRVLMELVQSFPSDKVGVCIDVGHAHLTRWKNDVIRTAAGRIITTHLHDNTAEEGGPDKHLVPGHGAIDWGEVMSAFHDAGYDGPWIFECGRPDEPPFRELPAAMEMLRRMWTGGV